MDMARTLDSGWCEKRTRWQQLTLHRCPTVGGTGTLTVLPLRYEIQRVRQRNSDFHDPPWWKTDTSWTLCQQTSPNARRLDPTHLVHPVRPSVCPSVYCPESNFFIAPSVIHLSFIQSVSFLDMIPLMTEICFVRLCIPTLRVGLQ